MFVLVKGDENQKRTAMHSNSPSWLWLQIEQLIGLIKDMLISTVARSRVGITGINCLQLHPINLIGWREQVGSCLSNFKTDR